MLAPARNQSLPSCDFKQARREILRGSFVPHRDRTYPRIREPRSARNLLSRSRARSNSPGRTWVAEARVIQPGSGGMARLVQTQSAPGQDHAIACELAAEGWPRRLGRTWIGVEAGIPSRPSAGLRHPLLAQESPQRRHQRDDPPEPPGLRPSSSAASSSPSSSKSTSRQSRIWVSWWIDTSGIGYSPQLSRPLRPTLEPC
jgi:hypothetical protein